MYINAIYNQDCLEGMKSMGGGCIDLVLTSPPYNTARNHGDIKNHEMRYDVYQEQRSNQEYIDWTISLFNEFNRLLKQNGCVLYNISYGNENSELMWLVVAEIIKQTNFTIADTIVWKKFSALPNNVSANKLTRICEFVFVFCRKDEYNTFTTNKQLVNKSTKGQAIYENIYNLIEAKNNDETQNLNKATFSTDLVKKLLKIYGKEGYIVLDPFMGTGTTAIGCIEMNINFLGFEISAAQCEYSNKRTLSRIDQYDIFRTIDYNKKVEI